MMFFRFFLMLCISVVAGYTAVTVADHGLNFLPQFFGDIERMGWPGQFNLDFLTILCLAALWLAWRHHFSIVGIVLGLAIFVGGMPLLAAYLLVQSWRTGGDIKTILLGEGRI